MELEPFDLPGGRVVGAYAMEPVGAANRPAFPEIAPIAASELKASPGQL